MASHSVTKLTEEQYLAMDRAAEFKSEYFDGEMFAMSGGSMQHARLQKNIIGELYNALRGGDCEPFGSDFRVRVSSRMYAYPDISIVCGKPQLADGHQDILLNPVVVIEVLSPSTEKYDRGLKLQHYRTITTLQDYILVEQNENRIDQYTRQENNLWILRDYQSLDQELAIKSIAASLSLRRIYDRAEFPAT
jgi:Uma2 family endonuclease